MDVATPSVHEPVLFQTARDPLGASYLGWYSLPYVFFMPLQSSLCLWFNSLRVQKEKCLSKIKYIFRGEKQMKKKTFLPQKAKSLLENGS